MSGLFDPGMQPERTMLAWQRTALSVGLGSLVYARIAAASIGLWAWALAGAGVLTAIVIGYRARRRYQYAHRSLTMGRVKLADGLLPALLAAAIGMAGLIILLLAVLGPDTPIDQL